MSSKRIKSICLWLLKLLGSGLFLWWVFSGIENREELGANLLLLLRQPVWLSLGLFLALAALVTAAWRWQILLRAQDIDESFGYLFRLTLYGALFSLISLGSLAGDAVKVICLARKRREQKVEVALSVAADHMCGFMGTAFIFLVAGACSGAFAGTGDELIDKIFISAAWFQIAGLVGVAVAFFTCTPLMRKFCERTFPKFAEFQWVRKTFGTMDLFRVRWRHALAALGVSFLLSGTYFLTFYAGLGALGEGDKLGASLAVMPLVDVAASLPISISGLGVRERTFEYLMGSLSGIPPEVTVSASLLGFGLHAFWALGGGVILLLGGRKTDFAREDAKE